MKAQRVSGLEGELPLSEAARRIVAVRTAELYAFVPEALGEHAVSAMHDMRIAASAHSEPEGFRILASRFAARRANEFARFLELWAQTEASGLGDRLLVTTFSSPAAEAVGA